MNWSTHLLNAYELINAKETPNYNDQHKCLLPLSHEYLTASIEVELDKKGNFIDATFITDPVDKVTISPVTTFSANRSNNTAPHGLHDSLSYLSGNNAEKHKEYLTNLRFWIDHDDFAHQQLMPIYKYVMSKSILKDLETIGLISNKNGVIKPIKKVDLKGDLGKATLRFKVRGFQKPWQNKSFFNSYHNYFLTQLHADGLCYVTGEETVQAPAHPRNVRFSGDSAKLISINNKTKLSYQGRFDDSSQVAGLSYSASQKIHNALKWLVRNHSYKVDGRVFIYWSTNNIKLPTVFDSSFKLLDDYPHVNGTDDLFAHLKEEFDGSQVISFVLDAPTKGRLSIMDYSQMNAKTYLNNLHHYHQTYAIDDYNSYSDQYDNGALSIVDLAKLKADPASLGVDVSVISQMVLHKKDFPAPLKRIIYKRLSKESIGEQERDRLISLSATLATLDNPSFANTK